MFGHPRSTSRRGRLFVGLGGYDGMPLTRAPASTRRERPSARARLGDAPGRVADSRRSDNVIRYTNTKPPMYSSREVGLSSPAVVNDVVFVSTSGGGTAGLYALSINDGHCLWSAGGLPAGGFSLGPAIFGNFVVVGAAIVCTSISSGRASGSRPRRSLSEAWPWSSSRRSVRSRRIRRSAPGWGPTSAGYTTAAEHGWCTWRRRGGARLERGRTTR